MAAYREHLRARPYPFACSGGGVKITYRAAGRIGAGQRLTGSAIGAVGHGLIELSVIKAVE